MKLPKPEEVETDNGWQERRPLHPRDIKLRSCGFKIYARPKRGPAQWERDHTVYTEADALALVGAEECTGR